MSHIIRPNVLDQNALAFEVGARYREKGRYRETPRYAARYGTGATPMQGCFNVSTGRIEGGPYNGLTPPPGTVQVSGGQAYISISGDQSAVMGVCGVPPVSPGPGSMGWWPGKPQLPPGCGTPCPPGPGCGTPVYPHGGDPCGGGPQFMCEEPDNGCEIKPPRCDCHVIGGNTLNNDSQVGIASGAFGTVQLDSGDAEFFVPYYMHIIAFEIGAATTLSIANGNTPRPVTLQDSTSGKEPNLRRASTTNASYGILTTVYGAEKELECVDWNRFASTTNQQLTLTFYNPNTVTVHIFVNLWGVVAV